MYSNKKGFSLIEVIVGIAILTIAIVASSGLLSGLIQSNQNNLTTMQAYYLAQEGLEAVRNVRDSNWLHNRHWLGEEGFDIWGDRLEIGGSYAINLNYSAFTGGLGVQEANVFDVAVSSPWEFVRGDEGGIGRREVGDNTLLTSGGGEPTEFRRTVELSEAPQGENYVLVEAIVKWEIGSEERELKLSTVLTNWKNGVL